MPTLWYVKEVPYDNSWVGGIQVSFDELRGAFGEYKLQFLTKNTPRFKAKEPSGYPRCVVIEVKEEDGTDGKFSQFGFYLFPDLLPEQAHQLLDDHRGKK
jgi:hypothetical protein